MGGKRPAAIPLDFFIGESPADLRAGGRGGLRDGDLGGPGDAQRAADGVAVVGLQELVDAQRQAWRGSPHRGGPY